MTATLQQVMLAQTDLAWRLVHRSLEGLTDAEFFWEPAPHCWSVRRRSELSFDIAEEFQVPGERQQEFMVPAPDPPPLTTIAWRVTHITLGTWNWIDIIAGRSVGPEPELPATAAGNVTLCRQTLARFRELVASLDDQALLMGPPKRSDMRVHLVSHVHTEVVHHGAEIGCMRDLHRNIAQGLRR